MNRRYTCTQEEELDPLNSVYAVAPLGNIHNFGISQRHTQNVTKNKPQPKKPAHPCYGVRCHSLVCTVHCTAQQCSAAVLYMYTGPKK
jgi:hypothetical protein